MSQQTKRAKKRRKQLEASKLPAEVRNAPDEIMFSGGAVEWIEAAGEESTPTFKGEAYTGGKMVPKGFPLPVVVDLQGISKARSIPALRDHNIKAVVGHWSEVAVGTSSITASGVASGPDPEAAGVIQAHKDGFRWQLSIGAKILAKKFVPQGKSAFINGRNHAGPFIHAVKSRLNEISFTAIGADDETTVDIAASADHAGGDEMTFNQWLEANGWDRESLTDGQTATLQASFAAETADDTIVASTETPKFDAAEFEAEMAKAAAASRTKIAEISRICASADNPQIKVDDVEVDLAAHALENGWDATKVELECLKASRAKQLPASTGSSGAPASDDVIQASLCIAAGVKDELLASDYSDDTIHEAKSAAGRRVGSIHALMYETIRASGGYYQPGGPSIGLVAAALEANQKLEASGFTTLSLPVALGNVANKMLLQGYNSVATTWQSFCSVASHGNFHTHTKVRMTGNGQFLPLGQDGEIKHGRVTEDTYTNRVQTQARMFTLTREDLINDDLGALSSQSMVLGRGAALGQDELFWRVMLGGIGTAFLDGTFNNLIVAVLGIPGYTAAEQLFMDQVDSFGKPIGVNPDRVGVPSTLKTLANQLFNDTAVNRETDLTMESNPYAGTYTPYPSPYLNNTAILDEEGKAITGQSDTHWFMSTDPAGGVSPYEMAFLQGRQTPIIETSDVEFNKLGVSARGYWDIGVAEQDPRAIVYSTGAGS